VYGIYSEGRVIAQFVVPTTMRSNQPIFSSDTLSLKRRTRKRPAQRWELETRLDPLTEGANDLMAELILADNSGIINIIVPQNVGAVRARTSSSTPVATGSAGTTQLSIAGNSGTIPKGTFIRFANHSKIYMLATALVDNGPLNLYPRLRANVSGVGFNYREDVIMNCKQETDNILGMVYEDGVLMDNGVIKLIESV